MRFGQFGPYAFIPLGARTTYNSIHYFIISIRAIHFVANNKTQLTL